MKVTTLLLPETTSSVYGRLSFGCLAMASQSFTTLVNSSGVIPACGAVAGLIERATGKKPYFVGKPNPLMMRSALNALGEHSENTIMVGDRMDTDVIAGMEAGMETVLVLSGVTRREDVEKYPFRPTRILNSVAELLT